jgi:RND family efflux transporter MFP subunit
MKQQRQCTSRIVVYIFCVLATFGCKEEQIKETSAQHLAPTPVKIFTIREEKATSHMEIMGTVQAAETAEIAARLSGHITEMPVVVGSKINKGDLLVKINAAEISAQLAQAKAQLTQTERNLDRERNLLKKNASTPETVKALEDTQRITLAAVKEVQTMLDYATVSAPFSGIVTRKNVNIGDLAVPGKPLLGIENDMKLQVVANIPETMILKIKVGDEIPVSVPAAGVDTNCKVEVVSPVADPLSRTAPIKLKLPSVPNLRSGQFARLSLPENTIDAILVPVSTVLPFGQMERVFVVTDGKARLRLVRTGATAGGMVEILAGLSPGDQVISLENKALVDGQPVTINQ